MYKNFYTSNFFINENYLAIKNETNDPLEAIENIAECLQQESNERLKRESVIKAVEKTTDCHSVDSIVHSYIKNTFVNIEDVRTQAPEAELLNNPFSYEELEYEFILSAVKLGNIKLEDVDALWKSNREIVKGALMYDKDFKNFHSSLQFASERLQDDKEVVLAAVKNQGFTLKFASERLQDDKEVVLATVKTSFSALQFVSERLQDDEEVVLIAMKNSIFALQLASARLREKLTDNRKFILSFIKKSKFTLQFASKRLQDDKEVILNVIKKSPPTLECSSKRLREKLKNHPKMSLHIVKRSSDDLEFTSKKLRSENPIHEVFG